MGLVKAQLLNISKASQTPIDVLFNPTEYEVERGAAYAELPIPGLDGPLYQFVRGNEQTFKLELFLDRTRQGLDIEGDLINLRRFIQIDEELHAPPVCQFSWGSFHFQGIVTTLTEKIQLFDESGAALRARVSMVLKRYRTASVDLREAPRASPDRSRVRVFREGETLAQIASEAYGEPRMWRRIAEENDIDAPRFVKPGTILKIPAL